MVADDRTMLGRVMAIIDICLDQGEPVSLSELVAATGLPKPTVWRIAQALSERGLLDRVGVLYTGGAGLAAMGGRVTAQAALTRVVAPQLSELQLRTAAAVWVIDVRSDADWPVVASAYGRVAAGSHYSEAWHHSPKEATVLASALGILAFAVNPARAEELMHQRIPRLTPYTETQPQRIHAAMEDARERQAVVEHGRFVLGWSCLTVPIADPRTGALTAVLGSVDRTPRFDTDRLMRAARSTAEAISRDLATAGVVAAKRPHGQ